MPRDKTSTLNQEREKNHLYFQQHSCFHIKNITINFKPWMLYFEHYLKMSNVGHLGTWHGKDNKTIMYKFPPAQQLHWISDLACNSCVLLVLLWHQRIHVQHTFLRQKRFGKQMYTKILTGNWCFLLNYFQSRTQPRLLLATKHYLSIPMLQKCPRYSQTNFFILFCFLYFSDCSLSNLGNLDCFNTVLHCSSLRISPR